MAGHRSMPHSEPSNIKPAPTGMLPGEAEPTLNVTVIMGSHRSLGIGLSNDNLVTSFMPDSVAKSSGLQLGDVVLGWQGRPLDDRRLVDVLRPQPIHILSVARASHLRRSATEQPGSASAYSHGRSSDAAQDEDHKPRIVPSIARSGADAHGDGARQTAPTAKQTAAAQATATMKIPPVEARDELKKRGSRFSIGSLLRKRLPGGTTTEPPVTSPPVLDSQSSAPGATDDRDVLATGAGSFEASSPSAIGQERAQQHLDSDMSGTSRLASRRRDKTQHSTSPPTGTENELDEWRADCVDRARTVRWDEPSLSAKVSERSCSEYGDLTDASEEDSGEVHLGEMETIPERQEEEEKNIIIKDRSWLEANASCARSARTVPSRAMRLPPRKPEARNLGELKGSSGEGPVDSAEPREDSEDEDRDDEDHVEEVPPEMPPAVTSRRAQSASAGHMELWETNQISSGGEVEGEVAGQPQGGQPLGGQPLGGQPQGGQPLGQATARSAKSERERRVEARSRQEEEDEFDEELRVLGIERQQCQPRQRRTHSTQEAGNPGRSTRGSTHERKGAQRSRDRRSVRRSETDGTETLCKPSVNSSDDTSAAPARCAEARCESGFEGEGKDGSAQSNKLANVQGADRESTELVHLLHRALAAVDRNPSDFEGAEQLLSRAEALADGISSALRAALSSRGSMRGELKSAQQGSAAGRVRQSAFALRRQKRLAALQTAAKEAAELAVEKEVMEAAGEASKTSHAQVKAAHEGVLHQLRSLIKEEEDWMSQSIQGQEPSLSARGKPSSAPDGQGAEASKGDAPLSPSPSRRKQGTKKSSGRSKPHLPAPAHNDENVCDDAKETSKLSTAIKRMILPIEAAATSSRDSFKTFRSRVQQELEVQGTSWRMRLGLPASSGEESSQADAETASRPRRHSARASAGQGSLARAGQGSRWAVGGQTNEPSSHSLLPHNVHINRLEAKRHAFHFA